MTRRSPLALALVGALGACTETDHDAPPRFFATEIGDGGALVEVDTGTGTVRRISGHGLEEPAPDALAFEASTGTFYAVRGGAELVRIDPEDFAVTRIGALGFTGVWALTLDESAGVLYAANESALLRVDPASGGGAVVTRFGFPLTSLAFDAATDTLFAISPEPGVVGTTFHLLGLDPTGGVRSTIRLGLSGYFGGFVSLAFDPRARRLLAGFTYFNGTSTETDLLELDTVSGAHTELGELEFTGVYSLTIDPATGTLFGLDSDTRQLIRIDPATGASASMLALALREPTDLTLDPATGTLYSVGRSSHWLFALDATTLTATPVGPLERDVHALAFDAGRGVLHAVDAVSDELVRIDPTSGASTVVGAVGSPALHALAYDPALDLLYGADVETGVFVVIEPESAASTPIGPLGSGAVESLVFDASARALYGVELGEGRLVRIDLATGAGSVVGPVGLDDVRGLALDPALGTCYGVDRRAQLATIRLESGAATTLGAIGFDRVGHLAFDPERDVLYGLQGESVLLRIEPANGTPTVVVLRAPLRGLAVDPGVPTLYGIESLDPNDGSDTLVTVDSASGNTQRIGAIGYDVDGLTLDDRTGTLYGIAAPGALIRIDPATGAAAVVALLDKPCGGLAFVGRESLVYATDLRDGGLLTIDPRSGVSRPVAQVQKFLQGLAGPIR